MPRMRTVKPEAFTSLSLSDVDRSIRWTFAGLWTHCDDDGNAAWDPRLLKAAIYPLDDTVTPEVVTADMVELERIGAVCFYDVNGRRYVHVPAWHEHQHPNRKVASKLPPCPKTSHTSMPHSHLSESAVNPPTPITPVVVVVEESRGDGEVEVGGADSAKPTRRATRIADEFKPSLDDISWARIKGIADDVARYETEKFINYWRAKSGKDATKLDWSATWRNWMLTAAERRGSPPSNIPAATAKAQGWLTVGREPSHLEITGAQP